MRDTDETRTQIAEALQSMSTESGATCMQVIRFRKHTMRSAGGKALDVIVDELAGPSDAVDSGPTGRPGEPGIALVAYGANGELGRYEVHPVRDDFEPRLMPLVLTTCRRLGCALEAWVEHERRSRWEPDALADARPGYRSTVPIPRDAVAASGVEMLEAGVRHVREERPRVWAAALLGVLCLIGFPITILAMLIGETRDLLVGMFTSFLNGYRNVWELTLDASALQVTAVDERRSIPRTSIRWIASWPRGWSARETGNVIRVVTEERAEDIQWPIAPEKVAPYLEALRRQ